MTYKDQFVVEIKADGKILRIKDDAVYLPFGCEYSILLKNLNSRKASVNVSIDGEDVLDGHSLIISPLETHDLKGFFSNTTVKNRFRFIQKTKEIQEHRGDKIDDGLVRVEFAFEEPIPEPYIKRIIKEVEEHHHHHHHHDYYPPWWYPYPKITWYEGSGWSGTSCENDTTKKYKANYTFNSCNSTFYNQVKGANDVKCDSLGVQSLFTTDNLNTPNLDEGITVKGNQINEQYRYSYIGSLEQPSVIVIALKGIQQQGTSVKEPITIQTKLTCSSCGKKSKSSFKFCPNCGTFLE